MPFVSITLALASLTYEAKLEGLINLSNSWVPFGKRLKIYSAPTIAVIQDLGFLLIVERKRCPPGLRRSVHVFTSDFGSGTCSKTSKHVTISKVSDFSFLNSSAVYSK